MSRVRFTKVATPSAPAANKVEIFTDTADRRVKQIDEYGTVASLANDGWKDKNLIINGDFGIAQRQVLTTATNYAANTNRTYGPDRWGMSVQTSSNQFAAIDTGAAPESNMLNRYYGKFTQVTGAGKLLLSQVIESVNFMHTWGQKVRFQVKLKYSAGAGITIRLGLMQLTSAGTVDTVTNAGFISAYGANGVDPTFPANHTLINPELAENGTIASSAVTCVLTGSWVRYSATFTVPSNCKNIIPIMWTNNQMAVNDALCVGECGLYYGTEIRDWTPKAEAVEMANCQRYYAKTFPILTAPAQNGGVSGALHWSTGLAAGVTTAHGNWRFPMRMRIAPATTTFYNPSATNAFARNLSLGTDCTATSVANACDTSLDITCTTPVSTVIGHMMIVHITADAEL